MKVVWASNRALYRGVGALMLGCLNANTAASSQVQTLGQPQASQQKQASQQAGASAQQTCSLEQLQGTWELASARYFDKSGALVGSITDGSTLSRKVIAGQHMAFITWQANGAFDVAASGNVQVEQGRYVERIDTASKPRLLGKTYRFACKLEGGNWLHSGDEDGIHIEEVWRRVP